MELDIEKNQIVACNAKFIVQAKNEDRSKLIEIKYKG